MQWFTSILQTSQVISSILVIVLVLLQQGKGADMGAAFGSGSAGSVFGSAGAANFLSRATKWAAIIFFVTTGGLAWVAHHPSGVPLESGIMSGFTTPAKTTAPAAGVGAAVPDIGTAVPSTGAAVPDAGTAVPGSDSAVPATSSPAAADASVPAVPASQGNAAASSAPASTDAPQTEAPVGK